PRHHRDNVPDRLPAARLCRPFQPKAAPGLRIRGLVLAFRRRHLAVPVRLHLRLGYRRWRTVRAGRLIAAPTYRKNQGRPSRRPFFFPSALLCGRAWGPPMTETATATLTEAVLR